MPLPANSAGLSPAGAALGLGDGLAAEVAGESEEQRKKRMAQLQQNQMLGPSGSMSATQLFGLNGGKGGSL